MKTQRVKSEFVLAILILFMPFLSFAQAPVTLTFTHTGAVQTFTMPPCVGSMTIEAKGAAGGSGQSSSNPGAGASVKAVMTASAGQVLFINVGGQGSLTAGGFNGGGNGGVGVASNGGGGGGASDIRLGNNTLPSRILVAAGGGGSGGNGYGGPYNPYGGNGGGGNPFTSASGFGGQAGQSSCGSSNNGGESGGSAPNYGTGGGGAGYISGGGGGGQGVGTGGGWGCNGALGVGGEGGSITYGCGGTATSQNGGGGGGGGFYGGGGGMSGSGGCNGGGGGGSSYCNNVTFSSITYTPGNISSGHGTVTITFSYLGALTNVSVTPNAICTGGAATLQASGVTSYTWNTGSNSNSIVVGPASTTAYTVSGTNTLGCISSAVVTVTVSTAPPTLSVNSSTNSVCPTNTVMLTASGALTYSWSGGVTNGVPFSPLSTTAYTVVGQNGCGIGTSVTTITVTSLPVVAISSSSVVCSGNTATLSAGGATSYTWQPGNLNGANVVVSPSSNTNYTVIGVAGVCAGISTVAVNTNPNPTITASASNSIVCGGESVTLTASGALGYTWQPGNLNGSSIVVNPTSPTAFVVTGHNNFGCLSTAQQPVIAFASPTIIISTGTPTICAGGSALLNASGANTYTWSGGPNTSSISVSPAAVTIYTVAGTNTTTQCSSSNTFEVQVLSPSLSISSATAICVGSSATLIATGADSYQWNTGASGNNIVVTPLSTTGYTVTGLVNAGSISCSASAVTSVTINPLPIIAVVATRTNICKNESTMITSSGASSYQWSNSATTASISVSPTINTTYSVIGTDANGCSNSGSILIRVYGCVGMDENSLTSEKILVYPNPGREEITITSELSMDLFIINELGQIVEEIRLHPINWNKVLLKNLPAGVYFIQTNDPDLKLNKKLIIQE